MVNFVAKGEYVYEFVRTDDKGSKMNVVSRGSAKNVYYCGL